MFDTFTKNAHGITQQPTLSLSVINVLDVFLIIIHYTIEQKIFFLNYTKTRCSSAATNFWFSYTYIFQPVDGRDGRKLER